MTNQDPRGDVILEGIVGSQAYGFAHPGSDVDRLGIFAYPSHEFLRMGNGPQMTVAFKGPQGDCTYHEAKKFCELAMSCNPSVLELLWLDSYGVATESGRRLIDLRQNFLSRKKVADSYLGYAAGQIRRLGNRLPHPDKQRAAKHARHIFRLLHQGLELYVTGELPVRLPYPGRIVTLGDAVAEGDWELPLRALHDTERKFAELDSVLPVKSNPEPINEWLVDMRYLFWLDGEASALGRGYRFEEDEVAP